MMKAKFPNLLIMVKTTKIPSSPTHDDLSRDGDLMIKNFNRSEYCKHPDKKWANKPVRAKHTFAKTQ